MEEEKKTSCNVVIVIILMLMVLGLGGFIFYDKVLSDRDTKPVSTGTEEQPEKQFKKIEITDEIREKIGQLKDLKSGIVSKTNVEDLDNKAKLGIAINLIPDDKITSYEVGLKCGEGSSKTIFAKLEPSDLKTEYVKLFGEKGYKDENFVSYYSYKYSADKKIYEGYGTGVCGDIIEYPHNSEYYSISEYSQNDNKFKVILDTYYYEISLEEGTGIYSYKFYTDETYKTLLNNNNSLKANKDFNAINISMVVIDYDENKKILNENGIESIKYEFMFTKNGTNLVLDSIEKIK